jgi:sRNA-binding carbon storage regulator CsrA
MLVFSRRNHESIVIGGSKGFERLLKLTVIDVTDGTVKLGVDVADDIPVHPWEAWERICAGAMPEDAAGAQEAAAAI